MNDPYLHTYAMAKNAQRRYPLVPLLDYVRTGHEWVSGHPKALRAYLDTDGSTFYYRRLQGHLEAFGLRETSHHNGFRVEDVYFYNLDVIAGVLPGLWDENYNGLPAEYEEIRAKRDAAEGNNWPALLADVGSAFKRASDETREVLFAEYALGQQWHDPGAVEYHLRRMRDLLGGARPQGCPNDCEECGNGNNS